MSADPAIVAQLEAIDARRAAATLAKDRATLESIYAPDCHYVHSSATDESAALFIERACTGHYDYRKLNVVKREWRTWGDTALCNGDVEIEVMARGNLKAFSSRYLQVWRKDASGWRIASWHSVMIPQA